jgi:hypothetical protein
MAGTDPFKYIDVAEVHAIAPTGDGAVVSARIRQLSPQSDHAEIQVHV